MKILHCYLCGGRDFQTRTGKVHDNSDLEVLECLECGLVFLDSQDHIAEDYYQNSKMHGPEPDYEKWRVGCQRDDRRRIRFLSEKLTNKSILDFGCGVGGFIELSKNLCRSVYGYEPEIALRKFFKERNLNVFHDFYSIIKSGKKFVLITAFHVIEHLKDPAKTLLDLSFLLKQEGEIIIETPSSSDALLSLYESDSFQNFTYWSNHLYLFNSKTIEKLSKSAGLALNLVENIQRFPISNHLHWLSKGLPSGHLEWSFLDSSDLSLAYEESLVSIGATDNVIASFKKFEK